MKGRWYSKPGIVLGALGLGVLAFFVAMLPPDVHFGGDCGEMACDAWCLGVGHPTGYPLYAMLGKLLSLIVPVGTVSWRVALLSALGGAVAVTLGALLVWRLTDDLLAAVVAGLALAADNTLASQATICEVYGLHLAFLALVLLAVVQYAQSGDRRWLNVAGLGVGLGAVHHVSIMLAAPAVAVYLLLHDPPGRDPEAPPLKLGERVTETLSAFGRMAGWAVLLLPIYLYFPIRAGVEPAMVWGETTTLDGFIAHLTGRMYAETLFDLTRVDVWRFFYNHVHLLVEDQQWLALLGLVGVGAAIWQRRPVGWLLVVSAGLSLGFAANYNVGDRANFTLPAHLATGLAAGLGAAWVRALVARRTGRGGAGWVALGVLLVALPWVPGPPYWAWSPVRRVLSYANMHGNRRAADVTDAALADVPAGQTLHSSLDELTNAFWYRQMVDAQRRDVHIRQVTYITKPSEQRIALDWIWHDLRRGQRVFAAWLEPWVRAELEPIAHAASVELVPAGHAPPRPLGIAPVRTSQPLPATADWSLGQYAARGPVMLRDRPRDTEARLVGLRSRTLARVQAQLVSAGTSGDWETVLLLVHQRLGKHLDGQTDTAPVALNDSTSIVRWYWWDAYPLRTDPVAGAGTRGLSTVVELPLRTPDVASLGDYEIRLGVRPRVAPPQAELEVDLAALRQQTVVVGWGRVYWR